MGTTHSDADVCTHAYSKHISIDICCNTHASMHIHAHVHPCACAHAHTHRFSLDCDRDASAATLNPSFRLL